MFPQGGGARLDLQEDNHSANQYRDDFIIYYIILYKQLIFLSNLTLSCWVFSQLLNKFVFMVSLLGNRGVLIKPVNEILSDFEMVYHIGYFILCALGFFCHEFFFSLLVRNLDTFV